MLKTVFFVCFSALFFMTMALGQSQNPLLEYDGGKLTMESGDGVLYDFGGGKKATKQGYKRRYYLFTDSPSIYISNNFRGEKSHYVSFHKDDTKSNWILQDDKLKKRWVTQQTIKSTTKFGFRRDKKRSIVLFDTKSENKNDNHDIKDTNNTVILVVLPLPHNDSTFTYTEVRDTLLDNDSLRVTIRIGRTDKVVFDSVYVNGVLLPYKKVKYHGCSYTDTPYYNIKDDKYAEFVICVPVSQKNLTATVCYRELKSDGTIEHKCNNFEIRLGSNVFKYIIISLIVIIAIALIVLFSKKRRQLLSKNVAQLEKQLQEANDIIAKLEKEKLDQEKDIDRSKSESENATNKEDYRNEICEQLQNLIFNIVQEIESKHENDYVIDKLRELMINLEKKK